MRPMQPSESVYSDSKGHAVVKRLSPQMLVTEVRGGAGEAMVLWYIREFHAFVGAATHKVDIFHDWDGVDTFTSEARHTFTHWARERHVTNGRLCRGVHTLVQSMLVYLSLEASGMNKGYVHAYRVRTSFVRERELLLLGPSMDPVVL